MFLYEVIDALDRDKLSYTLVGGYAMALHGIVRATIDVDLVICLRLVDFEKVEKALGKINLKSRIPVRALDIFKSREEFIENRNLIAWSFVDNSNPFRQVDVLINKDLRKLKTEIVKVSGRKISVATLSEILKMKKEAGRKQDLVDAENIERLIDEKKN